MDVEYWPLFRYFPNYQALLLLLILGMMRFIPIVMLAPFFGAKLIPGPIKMGFALSLSIVFLPQLAGLTTKPLSFDMLYVAMILKELFIGMFLGFFVSIPFYIAGSSGTLIDHQRGSASLMAVNPAMGEQVSPIGLLYNYVLIAVFYRINGPGYFLDSVSLSFSIVPPDRFVSASFFATTQAPIWQLVIQLVQEVMRIAAQLAAPALVAMFMSDLFLGIANRLAQQIPMSFLGWALKSLLGVTVLWAGWYFIVEQLAKSSLKWLSLLDNLLPTIPVSSG